MRYIDADKVISEIQRLRDVHSGDHGFDEVGLNLEYLGDFITTLLSKQEQPEVDIEKEIEEHAIYMPHGEFATDNELLDDMEWARKEFRHFYEVGFNAGKKK